MRKVISVRWGLSLVGLGLLACHASPPAFSAQGFHNRTHGYKIMALPGLDASRGELLPRDWQLDNYYWSHSELTLKDSEDYKTKLEFDLNGDGTFERRETAFIHDLRWVHARHNGIIWVRSVPVSNRLRRVDLDVLLADYVNEISGAGYEGVAFGGRRGVVEHRYVAKVVRQTPAELAGQEAIDSELEVANSEQLKLDPQARWQRVHLVLARGPRDHFVAPAGHGKLHPFPVVLVVGYENSPDHFGEGEPDFEHLLSRFAVHKRSGFHVTREAPTADTDEDSDDEGDAGAPALPEPSAAPPSSAAPPPPAVPSAAFPPPLPPALP